MTRAARHHRQQPAPVPRREIHPDTSALRDLGLKSVTLYAERDPRAAAVALARGASRQTRGAKAGIVAALVSEWEEREPGITAECAAYLSSLRASRPAA